MTTPEDSGAASGLAAEPGAPADGSGDAPTLEPRSNGAAGGAEKKKKKKKAELSKPDAASPEDPEGAAEEAANDDEDEPPLLPEGNPPRWLRGGALLAGGSFFALVLMTLAAQLRFGVPLGALAIAVATFGALDLLGSFDDPDEAVAGHATLATLARPLALAVGGGVALLLVVTFAVAGYYSALERRVGIPPIATAALLVPAAFMTMVVGVFRVGVALGCFPREADGSQRPLLKRHGFWLVVAMTVVYLPLLGSHSLSDPWETHYGEVSREILARNDWISLWWAQDGFFWSKPVLDMWMQALAMATFGVRYTSGAMLSAVAEGHEPFPEWAVRLPVFLLTLVAVYLLYRAVAGVFGRRAGLLGGLVLLSMPQFFLLAHQTMTDMPFVAPMAACMALFLLGANTDPERRAKVFEVELFGVKLRFSAFHLVFGLIAAFALPQVLYLLSRNLEIRTAPFDLRVHADAFNVGSPGNCGLPGNEACKPALPVLRGLHPSLQALIWAQALALVLYLNWGERRTQRLYFLAAWFFAALSTMAKGPAGFGLPILAAFAFIAVSRRWKDLARLEIASGTLVLAAVALPWFVAMYARHGQPFTDRLLFHDMFKRAFTHVHDTNEGDDVSFRFYVWQLGYATFPWTGLLPIALVSWFKRREGGKKSDALVFLGTWFLFGFALFSLMLTKFHHYILPVLPAAAMLMGITLDEALGVGEWKTTETAPKPKPALYVAGMVSGTLFFALGMAKCLSARAAFANGFDAFASAAWGGLALFVLGAATLTLTVLYAGLPSWLARVEAPSDVEDESTPNGEDGRVSRAYAIATMGAAGLGGALVMLLVGRDLAANDGPNANGAIRLIHLITYNYKRPWPPSLDLSAPLWAATIASALFTLLIAVPRLRQHAVVALTSFALVFAAWGLDVYLMKTSPHWGQRETMLAYYRSIQDKPGPIVAYQMNWKGENFYTGNHVAAFVGSGKTFQDYILGEKKKGVKTFYFVAEHSRVASLQTEIGSPKDFAKLTTAELDNKFTLVRATFE